MSASVLSRLLIVLASETFSFTERVSPCGNTRLDPESVKSASHSILRANPFPEVTDLICRIPLSTLFYRPEAANLGDLMRLWVRPGVIGQNLTRIFKDRYEHH